MQLFKTLNQSIYRLSTRRNVAILNRNLSQTATYQKKDFPTLSQFLLRNRVLSLYRVIIRATNKIPHSSSSRHEMKSFARAEFERHRQVVDETTIRYLISTGKTEFEKMERYVLEQAM